MAEWPGTTWSGRGTRTQFRLGPAGGFLRGIHPVRGDIMDVGPAVAAGLSTELASSNKATRTRTVREYEQTISELKKENFDLKLKIYMSEEGKNKISRKDKDSLSQDKDNTVQVMVQLKLETESLRNELSHKDNLLQEALAQVEKHALSVKELTNRCAELQHELSLLSGVPSKEEFALLLHEKDNLLKQIKTLHEKNDQIKVQTKEKFAELHREKDSLLKKNKTLERCLQEKEEDIEMANQRLDILANENSNLEEKKKERDLAIRSFLIKDYQEKEMLPDELKRVAISAVQAAKNGKKEAIVTAVKTFNAVVCQILKSSFPTHLHSLNKSVNSPYKCLEEENVEKRSLSLPSQNVTSTDLSSIQLLEKFLSEGSVPITPEKNNLDSFIQNSFLRGMSVKENSAAEKDFIDFKNYFKGSPTATENAMPISLSSESQRCTSAESSVISIENIFAPTTPPVMLHHDESVTGASTLNSEQSLNLETLLKENMQQKETLKDKLADTEGLWHAYEELKSQIAMRDAKENVSPEVMGKSVPVTPEKYSLECFIRNSYLQGPPTVTEKASPVSLVHESQSCTTVENITSSIENVFAPTTSPVSLHQNESSLHKSVSTLDNEQSLKLEKILKENVHLKEALEDKLVVIEGLRQANERLKSQLEIKEVRQNGAVQVSSFSNAVCQTDVSLSRLNEVSSLEKSYNLSNNINELREDILLLQLTIEGKNKELSDAKQDLSAVQADLKQALESKNQTLLNEDCVDERNELHERLAFSCSVNAELIRHLHNLEAFMEDLLQHKLDSSLESASGRSSFFSNVSKCLNESLRLSNALSDHLSICEGSKLFEECKSMLCRSQSEEKSFSHLDVSESSVPDYPAELNMGIQVGEPHQLVMKETFGCKDFELFYRNTLCQKCCQQVNSPMAAPELNLGHTGYPSSDSDIWSEPDRNVSLQRIGINVQISPTSSKSPRKLRSRDKRKLSTDHNTSSSDVLHSSRLRRNGTSCRRLFGKDSNKHQDFMLEKYHFLISEKFSRLKALLSSMENMKNEDLTADILNKINSVMATLGETVQKLQLAKDHTKSFLPAVCGKCVVLELLLELKAFPEHEVSSDLNSFHRFQEEISLLKEECDEPFSLLPRRIIKVSRSIQSDPLSEQEKITELEQMLAVLNNKNEKLADSLNEVQNLFTKEKNLLEIVEAENIKLSNETKHLKGLVSDLQNKRNALAIENTELVEKCTHLNKDNSELNDTLQSLELTKKESDTKLDQLTADLQKNKSDLAHLNIKCMELEKKLNDQTKQKEEFVEKFRSLQTSFTTEREKYKSEIENISVSKNHYVEKLRKAEEKILHLEKEIFVIGNSLDTKNNELKSLLEKVESLQNSSLLETVQAENIKLCDETKHLKEVISDLQNKGNELSTQNAELVAKVTNLNKDNSELNDILKSLEQTKKDSDAKLDQFTSELQKNKSELVNMSIKCLELEKELNDQIKQKEEFVEKFNSLQTSSTNEMEKYINEIDHLNLTKNCCIKKLEKAEVKILDLEKEISVLNNSLHTKNNELKALEKKVESLQCSQETLTVKCAKLQSALRNSDEQCTNLQKDCNSYEDEASQRIKVFEEYRIRLQHSEEQFLSEKTVLINKISLLTSERDTASQKLKLEKENFEQLMVEKMELNQKLVQSCQQIATLKNSKEKVEGDCTSVLLEKENIQSTLLSSDAKCILLGKDLAQMRETLQNLKSKCKDYEKELVASAGIKKSLVDCLLNIYDEFSSTRQKMLELCKSYDVACSVDSDEVACLEFLPAIDEDSVPHLCDIVNSGSKKLLNTIDIIIEVLKSFHMKSQEVQLVQDKYTIKIKSIKKQMELQTREMEHLQSQNDFLKRIIEDKQKSTSDDNEKLEKLCAFEIQSFKAKLQDTEKGISKGKLLLKTKDDEITTLQEKLFNLQTYINSMLVEKNKISKKLSIASMKSIDEKCTDSVLPNNSLPPELESNRMSGKLSSGSLKSNNEKQDYVLSNDSPSPQLLLKASGLDADIPDIDIVDNSATAPSFHKNSCCEKYYKKCHSLQKKLSLYRKKIQILEEEKANLREFQSSNSDLNAADKGVLENAQLLELESKLEQKKSFITELKGELLKVCNSLIDKEREVDNLKVILSKYESKSKSATDPELLKDISTEGPKALDVNIKNLTNYKWTLIQMIFDVQRSFYEGKRIHLNYFDQFKDHVNALYSLQQAHTLSKSESLPLLTSLSIEQGCSPSDYRFKHLVGLELDIECLENLKIFLNRFFVPCVTQPETPSKAHEMEPQKSKFFSSKLNISALPRGDDEKSSIENFMWNVSQHIDVMKDFFDILLEWEQLENLDFTSAVNDKVCPLLLNILAEATRMHEGAEILFDLNAALKKLDVFPSQLVSKPDISDRESVLSEETITISRSETPLSTDDLYPLKLNYSPSLKLNEHVMPQKTSTERSGITSAGETRCRMKAMTIISSSCDSIHHRSQYSSPDLGIESDPNHESSIPEQKEKEMSKYQKSMLDDLCTKEPTLTTFETSKWKGAGSLFIGDHLHAIGNLSHYELLKREIQESLVGMKSVLSRTGEGMHQIANCTSPKKALEYRNMKSIKDTCANIEVCLKKAYSLVEKFWTAHCPSEQEWNALLEENQRLCKQLNKFKDLMQNQENEFKKAMGRLEHAQQLKANMEKKISKKLVKTKKVIRQAELKLLENRCQNCPPVPKYPLEEVPNLPQDIEESSMPK